MVSQINFQQTFIMLETFENGLNLLGYVPFIGSIGAVTRNVYAQIEAIAGVIFGALAIGLRFQGNQAHTYFVIAGTLLGHSMLNGIRSCFEAAPGVALLSTLPYDLMSTWYFGRRFFSYV